LYEKKEEGNILLKLLKRIVLVGFILTVFSCPGTTGKAVVESKVDIFNGRDFRDSTPHNGGLVFLGAAQYDGYRPDLERDRAIERALDDAARKAAFFYSVGGRVALNESRASTSFLDYQNESQKELFEDAEAYKMYRDDLEYDKDFDIFEDKDMFGKRALFVRARYTKANLSGISYDKGKSNERPKWVDSPPKIEGYLVAVGFTTYRSNFKNTIVNSYENAVYALIGTDTQVRGSITQTLVSSGGSNIESENTQEASGHLSGFYVLEIWQDPKTSDVYTLAIAKERTN
jgi:hypothetical protein